MKKKTIANLAMVAIIVLILAAGLFGVGHIRGWFDAAGDCAVLQDVTGLVHLRRNGAAFPVENATVLRAGDQITAQTGAKATIVMGTDYITLGSGADLTVSDPEIGACALGINAGELFVHTVQPVTLAFDDKKIPVSDATAAFSVRSGAQTVSVFRGAVSDATAGTQLEFVNGEAAVRKMSLSGLNDFMIGQIRETGKITALCYTEQDLNKLEQDRQQALQNMISGHTHSYTVQLVEPTCVVGGYTLHTCECGEEYRELETPAAGHRYTARIVAPDCVTGGYTEYLCDCGELQKDTPTDATGHSWGQWQTLRVATTTQDGRLERRCLQCDTTEEMILQQLVQGHTHSYTQEVIASTCTTDGYTLHSCACGDSYTDQVISASGHQWGRWGTLREPTTSSDGLQERICGSCQIREQSIIARLPVPHTHSHTSEVIAPTCTAQGFTRYRCPCGDSYTDQTTPATGHRWDSWKTVREATASAEGLQERTCGSCQTTEQKNTPKLSQTHTHSHIPEVIAPGCTTQGFTQYRCDCGDSYTDSPTSALGHSWSDWVILREATATAEGLRERSCTRCSFKEQSPIAMTEPEADGYVYITIVCDTILDNMDSLSPGKAEFVPSDGVILPAVEAPFHEGDTVFDVLKRVCGKAGIQLEYSWTPLYDSYYIEGIHNLYEFDCGEQSGWMYKVNEWFPNYGCSSYTVSDGDAIVWCYTCQGWGADVGDSWMGE